MLLEDYKQYDPVTEADVMAGDYPKLPIEYNVYKDKHYNWDIPELRRNYGEPLQENWNLTTETRFTDADGKYRYTRKEMYTMQLQAIVFIGVMYYLFETGKVFPKVTVCVMGEQLLTDDKTYYTFEVPE